MQPIIFHLDMNSYFATVEQQDNPVWRGQVLGVCEHLGGIIIAASIEAKKWGIKTGTPVWEAKKIYPKIILTHTRAEAYRNYNRKLVKLVSDYVSEVEVASIDEVYLDMTKACNIKIPNVKYQIPNKFQVSSFKFQKSESPLYYRKDESYLSDINPWQEAVRVAQEIKKRMKTEVGDYLTCSIGIADNKLLAKIASDMQKPNGLTVISDKILNLKSEILNLQKEGLYQKLKLTDIPGIGRRMEKRLNALGIRSLVDLKNYPQSLLVSAFGINGYHLYNMGQLNGSWKAQVHQEQDIKSIGHMYTLPKEYRYPKYFVPVLYKLCEMVGRRLRKKKLAGNIIYFYLRPSTNFFNNHKSSTKLDIHTPADDNLKGVKIGDGASDKNYEGYGESRKLDFYIYDGRDIFMQCIKIYERIKIVNTEFKLIGVTVAGLAPASHQQSLFKDEAKKEQLVKALDSINQKYGDFTVCRAPILAAGKVFHDSVGFGRIKEI